jgi:chromosome segregation ATPase
MSEIKLEMAIEVLQGIRNRVDGKDEEIRDIVLNTFALAIQALTEKLEREQGCEMTEIDRLKGQNELLKLEIKCLRIDYENTGYALEQAIKELEQREKECKEFCNDCDKCETIPLYKEVTK